MAKNIKKRSASHIYFGVNKLTGELKHISEVPSGQKCNCICAACLQPFEARKGTRRRHHFAHVSNYECMYASEVAIYKAFAEALKQSGFLTLPPVMLRFPAWHDPELLQEARRLKIDSVAFECEPLSYPPLLRVTMQGTPLRILLDFDRYYDDDDRVELAEEAKAEDYSLLLISMPKIEQDTEFTPDRLQSVLQDNDRTEWVFSRLEEQWKQKYYAVAVSPLEHGTGSLCPISFGKYKGKYSARWIDCAHCHFNVAQPPCCLCVAGAGIQKKEDFKRDLQDRLFDIDKIRRTNEEEIRLREERERSFERRSVYPRPTPYLNYLADADDSVDLSIQVTRSPDEFSSSVKIDDDIYIWTGTATQYKVNLLRKFFEQYKQDPSDLVFFLDDSRGIGSDEEIERYKIRRKYWESVLPSLQEATGTFLNISPSKNNSIMGATARSGVYLCCVANYDSARVEIFIDQGDYQKNRAIYNHLEQNRDAIEAAYGKSLHWICQDDVRACKVYDEIKEVSIKNEEDWPVMSAFHIQRAKALLVATKQFLA